MIPACGDEGRDITTLEGLGSAANLHPVQQAFIEAQAAQCGYCLSGMVMTATALLQKNRDPSDADVRAAMNGNLCRCGTQLRIVRAIKRAAKAVQGGAA